MLKYLCVSSFDVQALWALEDKFFEDLLDDAMHLSDRFVRMTLHALPLALLRNHFGIAVMAIHTVAFRALFRLVYYKFANATLKVIHCLG